MEVLKRKMKFLATKLSSLQAELKVSRQIIQEASIEVQKMFDQKYFPEIPVEPEEQESEISEFTEEEHSTQREIPDIEEQLSADKSAAPEVRKMFRKIATQCHPDKLHDMTDGFEKRKKEELYEKARQALESDDMVLMADVASELGMEIPEISKEQLKKTEQKIMAIKKELHQIESTLVWHWFFIEDAEQKETILKKLFQAMYEQQQQGPRS